MSFCGGCDTAQDEVHRYELAGRALNWLCDKCAYEFNDIAPIKRG